MPGTPHEHGQNAPLSWQHELPAASPFQGLQRMVFRLSNFHLLPIQPHIAVTCNDICNDSAWYLVPGNPSFPLKNHFPQLLQLILLTSALGICDLFPHQCGVFLRLHMRSLRGPRHHFIDISEYFTMNLLLETLLLLACSNSPLKAWQ